MVRGSCCTYMGRPDSHSVPSICSQLPRLPRLDPPFAIVFTPSLHDHRPPLSQVLFWDKENISLMEQETFEQSELPVDILGDQLQYLQEGVCTCRQQNAHHCLADDKRRPALSDAHPLVGFSTAMRSTLCSTCCVRLQA